MDKFKTEEKLPLITKNSYPHQQIAIDHNQRKSTTISNLKPRVAGKFIFIGEEKFYIKGVSYGAFRPDEIGNEYQDKKRIEKDFKQMCQNGINTVRIPHTSPPRHLLDIAAKHGLKVMIGLSAEQYVGYLIDTDKKIDLFSIIREKLEACKNHSALLCISIGNEIPASMVRWIGKRKVEKYLKSIYNFVKREIPESIVTYVNYPTTEYLDLSFLDILSFNVYLESKDKLEPYLYRLQNLAGNRPLLMGEIGLDSMRNGLYNQAESLNWQIDTVFDSGCLGLIIFSWTDEWYRGEEEVSDWAFGLTTREREPKPSLIAVKDAFERNPFQKTSNWPLVSVIVCVYNGYSTIRECLMGIEKLNYPSYEVIVVDDGSTDNTHELVSAFDVRLIRTSNNGLSHARNLGLRSSKGEIIAYIDSDAYPDQDWLSYLVQEFKNSDFAAIGGPNVSPGNLGFKASCVNYGPGSPTHVLYDDRTAEHIPGCNMAFKKSSLEKIGGFDPLFRIAGDDVDICWRFQEIGEKIGFSPSALVWHHRRKTISSYWKQQYFYGKAEAFLEKKWPKKYNEFGHRTWQGKIYGDGMAFFDSLSHKRIYGGIWGTAPFQSVYEIAQNHMFSFCLMPEWYLLIAFCFTLSLFGFIWPSLFLFAIVGLILCAIPMTVIIPPILKINTTPHDIGNRIKKFAFHSTVLFLFTIQPLARLLGRISSDLTPWRRYGATYFSQGLNRKFSVWTESWLSPEVRLEALEKDLEEINPSIMRGGDFDRWDIGVKGGAFGGIKLLMASEDHPKGNQYLRYRLTPYVSKFSIYSLAVAFSLVVFSSLDGGLSAAILFLSLLLILVGRIYWDICTASGCCAAAIKKQKHAK
ncbi:glycosyltransferase [Pleomorphovibrio marinus]|uniref:glycosyltransferase n=1 Tax=Pleomorphovibrio marinus TaxID=2164132 RepID=UPI000E0AA40A|nr:glycosyltransferase [Pleomorphovibrio marinus]